MAGGRGAAAAALLALLGACAAPAPDAIPGPGGNGSALAGYDRAVERSVLEAPFANGAMAVVTPGVGELDALLLVPCREGRAVCEGGPGGPAGGLRATPDWLVVTGPSGGTYWLGRGGKGFVERGGLFAPLAWAARAEGPGVGPDDGSEASLETAAPHGPANPLAAR